MLLDAAESLSDTIIETRVDDSARPSLSLLELPSALTDTFVEDTQLLLDLIDAARALVDASELGRKISTEHGRNRGRRPLPPLMTDPVRSVQNGAEQLELPAQDVEGQALGIVLPRQEVDHRHVALLPIAMAAADALLDTLGVPGQIVVDQRVAELQVEPLGAGLR